MKIRRDVDRVLSEDPSPEFDHKMRAMARAHLRGEAAKPGLLAWLFSPPRLALGGLAAGAAVVAVIALKPGPSGTVASLPDPEMVREAELLSELKVLEAEEIWAELEKRSATKPKS